MASLQGKVKNALDETRILMLGSQVLLGFQYRAFLEKGFDKLPGADKALQIVALFALLVTVGALFLVPARHRLIEGGNDSERFQDFIMLVARVALAPFSIAITLDLAVAGERIMGPSGGAAVGALTGACAVAFLYGPFAHRDRRPRPPPEDGMEKTDLSHRIVQVLTEARVVLPGAQALLGFQLAMVLMEPFEQLPKAAKVIHLCSLGFIALATIVLMAPAAYHRIVENGEDTERFHSFASRMVLLAMALIAPGLSGELYVVLLRAGFPGAAPVCGLVALASFYLAWFGATLLVRRVRPQHLRAQAG